jgi:hypothetical protein
VARIRTIKPEFPQSQSIGRLTREARYCFIMLWTQADDAGRLRGHSRMLASLLFPYDDDAGGLIDGWLSELERHGRIRRYQVDGNDYIEITNWLEHQKIDKPSPSKLPAFSEASRTVAKPREPSSGDRDQGRDQGAEGKGGEVSPPAAALPSEEARQRKEIGQRVLDLASIDPARWTGNFAIVSAWLNAKYDPDLDIFPAVQAVAKREGYQPPRSLAYFTPAIEQAWRERSTDIPSSLKRDRPKPKPISVAEYAKQQAAEFERLDREHGGSA